MPYVFSTQEKRPWIDFAENAKNGPSTEMLKRLALKFSMVIISPIFELKEENQTWVTAVVFQKQK